MGKQALDQEQAESSEWQKVNLYYDAVDKYKAHDFAGALAILDALAPQVTDPETSAAVRDLRQKAIEAQRVDAFNRLVARYNEAIAKGKAGDFQGAVKILEELLPQVHDPALAAEVRDTLEQARELARP